MKKLACHLFVYLVFFATIQAQTPLSGIVNDYAAVAEADTCMGLFVVDDPTPFQAGEPVLIIQMQGASIDQSNSSSFGDVLDYAGAGFYERAVVAAVQGDSLFMQQHLLHDYQVAGHVQIVSLPQYTSAVVVDTLRAQAWNGQTGGVLALEVSDTLFLEAPVILDGQGFRGGLLLPQESSCQWFLQQNDWYYALSDWRGAAKGEGIANFITGKDAGRGAQANGGGGGNDHNSGGGGGGHVGAQGGQGGNYYFQSIFGCPGIYPGRGGKALQPASDRIFMGGGGGSGHANDLGAGSGGGHGGGIFMVEAGVLVTNGFPISSSGLSANMAQGDGGGGGGAAGTVAIFTSGIQGNAVIRLTGGDGGGSNSEPERCYGPGGGGSGGRLMCNLLSLNPDLSGGLPGENTGNLSQCDGTTNGAQAGEAGLYESWAGLPQGTEPFVYPALTADLPDTLFACEGDAFVLTAEVAGENLSVQWQVDEGSGFMDIPAGASDYAGQQTAELTIFAQPAMQGNRYRLVLSHPCFAPIVSGESLLWFQPSPSASFSSTVNQAALTADFVAVVSNADSLWWDFGDGTGVSTDLSVSHTYASGGSYTVALTVFNACGFYTVEEDIFFGVPPLALFSVDLPSGCAPHVAQFENQSLGTDISWQWYFPGGNPSTSTDLNPVVSYPSPRLYDVSLIVENNLGADTLEQHNYIEVVSFPSAAFSWEVNDLEVSFFDNSVGDVEFYEWDFGDGSPVSNEQNPVHVFPAYDSYLVSFTAGNLHCSSIATAYVQLKTDGTGELSSLWSWTLYPNPSSGDARLRIESPEAGPLQLQLYDALGRLVYEREESLHRGKNEYLLALRDLPKGIYYLRFTLKGVDEALPLVLK